MPEIIQCPECGRKLRVPDDMRGKRVKCPGCGAPFTAGGDGQPQEDEAPKRPAAGEQVAARRSASGRRPAEPEEEERPRRREDEGVQERPSARRRPDADDDDYEDEDDRRGRGRGRRRPPREKDSVRDWQKVRLGVTLTAIAIITAIVLPFLMCCAGFAVGAALVGSSGPKGPNAGTAAVGGGGIILIAVLGFVGSVLVQALTIAGNGLCMFAPQRNAAKMLAIISFALVTFALLLSLAGQAIELANLITTGATAAIGPSPLPTAAGGVGPIIGSVGGLLRFAHLVVFLFFLRAVCLAMREDGLATSVVYLMILGLITILVIVVVFVLALVGVIGGAGLMASGAAAGPGGGGGGGAAGAGGTLLAGAGILMIAGSCLFFILVLAFVIWYIVTLFQVRGAITNYLGGRE
ncbi:MAG TPA: hypothetical protein VFA26_15310 [Gemmataceae bacterium]|nr:hypothetical protein [Gemmataceae bacterium]